MNKQTDIVMTQEQSVIARSRASLIQVQYNPGNLLDALIVHLDLKNDAALSRRLEVAPPIISKIRHRTLPVSGAMLIRMHEESKLTIGELRIFLGDHSGKFRMSNRIPRKKTKAIGC